MSQSMLRSSTAIQHTGYEASRTNSHVGNGLGAVDVGDIQRTAATLGEECPDNLAPAPEPARREETSSTLRLKTEGTVQVGDSVNVAVVLEEPKDVAGLEVVLAYSSSLLTLANVSLSERWTEYEGTTELLGPRPISLSNSLGHAVIFGAYTADRVDGLEDDGVVAQLTFTAESPGRTELQVFEAQVSDTQGTLSQPRRRATKIKITEE